MSLQRKFLRALGIDDDKAEEIITAHVETVDALKSEIARYKEQADKVTDLEADKTALETENKNLKDQLEEAKQNASDFSAKQTELDNLKQEFEEYKEQVKAGKAKADKTNAFRALLKAANINEKRFDAIIKLSGDAIDKIAFDKDGNVKDHDDLVKSITDDWSDYVVKVEEKGAPAANPPANTGGELVTKDSIMAIKDRAERQKAIAEHSELFGF